MYAEGSIFSPEIIDIFEFNTVAGSAEITETELQIFKLYEVFCLV